MENEIPKEPHFGQIIQKALTARGMNRSDLARATGQTPQAAAATVYQAGIRATRLWEISVAMKHNFFADVADLLPKDYPASATTHQEQRITDLEKQVEKLEMQVEIYEKALRIK